MAQELQKLTKKTLPNKGSVYLEFILWTAMPFKEKENLGIETQNDFAAEYKVDISTLSRWKTRADFEARVDAILKMWSTDKTPDVVHSIYRTAIKGNPLSQMLWLQYFKKFNPKKIEDEEKKVELSAGDIRFAIEKLPEQLKEKHYGYLRELAEDINAIRNARDPEDNDWYERPPEAVPDETDNDAQIVSNEDRPHAVAIRHTECVCEDLERFVSQSNHKSTERWR